MKRRIRAELWDKMQYLFRRFYDRMMRAAIYYDAPVDAEIAKELVVKTLDKAPILRSRFRRNIFRPYWTPKECAADDVVTVRRGCADVEAEVERFLCEPIPLDASVQIKIGLFDSDDAHCVAFVINHMCFDGGDFKYFLRKFCENYCGLKAGRTDIDMKTGTRDYAAVYGKFEGERLKTAKNLVKNISATDKTHRFPLTPPDPADAPVIARIVVEPELFGKFRAIGRKLDATVNDLLLCFYFRALYDFCGFDKSRPLAVPCMVDLRRHIKDVDETTGLTNHTGFAICELRKLDGDANATLAEIKKVMRKNREDPFLGLYGLPLLNGAFRLFPHFMSEWAILTGYANPLIGMSNIGALNPAELRLGDATPVYAWMTGAVKYKPYMQLAFVTMSDKMTISVAVRGNAEDRRILDAFLAALTNEMRDFVASNESLLRAPAQNGADAE